MKQSVTGEGGVKTSTPHAGAEEMVRSEHSSSPARTSTDYAQSSRDRALAKMKDFLANPHEDDAAAWQEIEDNCIPTHLLSAEKLRKVGYRPTRPVVDVSKCPKADTIMEINTATYRPSITQHQAQKVNETDLHPSLVEALTNMDITGLMTAQQGLLKHKHKTVLMNGMFASGRTFAAVLLLLDVALRAKDNSGPRTKGKSDVAKPAAMYMSPADNGVLDLAVEIRMHGNHQLQALTFGLCYGGAEFEGTSQVGQSYTHTDILFACPGKASNSIRSNKLDMARASLVVFDEADTLFGHHLEGKASFMQQFLNHLREARGRQEIPETLGLPQAYITLSTSEKKAIWNHLTGNLYGKRECWPKDLCWLDMAGTILRDGSYIVVQTYTTKTEYDDQGNAKVTGEWVKSIV